MIAQRAKSALREISKFAEFGLCASRCAGGKGPSLEPPWRTVRKCLNSIAKILDEKTNGSVDFRTRAELNPSPDAVHCIYYHLTELPIFSLRFLYPCTLHASALHRPAMPSPTYFDHNHPFPPGLRGKETAFWVHLQRSAAVSKMLIELIAAPMRYVVIAPFVRPDGGAAANKALMAQRCVDPEYTEAFGAALRILRCV